MIMIKYFPETETLMAFVPSRLAPPKKCSGKFRQEVERTSQDIGCMEVSTPTILYREVKMNAKKSRKPGCDACSMQNVQVQTNPIGLGQNSIKRSLRIASGHNIHSFAEFVSKCYEKCPSPCPSPAVCPSPKGLKCPSPNSELCPSPKSKNGKPVGEVMENDQVMIWLPLARVAEISGKSVKTIRRLVKEGSLAAVNRTVASGKCHTTKTFIFVHGELLDIEMAYRTNHGQQAVSLAPERIDIGSDLRDCLFITSYIRV